MSKSSKEDEIIDDLCVRREEIEKLFHPKPARTTFHDWVNKGLIVMARGLRGYYLLNKTRVRLGMNPVDLKRYRKEMAIPQVDSEQFKENFEKENLKSRWSEAAGRCCHIRPFSEAGRNDQSPPSKSRLCTTAPLFLPRAVVTLSFKRAKLENS